MILVVVFLAAGLLYWRFTRHWYHLDQIISDLAQGRQPGSYLFQHSSRFGRLARRLELMAEEQRQFRKRIEEEKFNFEAILAGMVEGVMVVGDDHVIRMVNSSFLNLFALKTNPEGQTVLGALREAAIEELVKETLSTGKPTAREVSRPLQPQTHFAVNAVPLRDEQGKINGVVGVFHDISRLRQLEEMRREFVANVSHELRTPLSIFHGYLENLLDCPDMPLDERGAILSIMRKHSLRLNALLEDLLTIARLESRREKLEFSEIHIRSFVGELLNEWSLKMKSRNITAKVEAEDSLPAISADQFRLEQVLNNLLENAIKFTPPGGNITVSASVEGGLMVIRVADTGMGIPHTDLPHVFEQFYRVEKARSREAGGTGLGLSIVKHIVTLHGGSVKAESTLGKGAVIILSLPLRR